MKALINNLVNRIKILHSLVVYLLIPYIKNSIVPKSNKPVNKPYRKIEVDTKLPIVENTQFYDYKALLKDYESKLYLSSEYSPLFESKIPLVWVKKLLLF